MALVNYIVPPFWSTPRLPRAALLDMESAIVAGPHLRNSLNAMLSKNAQIPAQFMRNSIYPREDAAKQDEHSSVP
jgi:hypothetical protein